MGRRRKNNDDLIIDVGRGFILLVALGFLVPQVRQVMLGLGPLLLALLGILAVVLFLVVIVKISSRRNHPTSNIPNILQYCDQSAKASAFNKDNPFSSPSAPTNTAADLINKLRSVDWFQFEQVVGLLYRKQGYLVTRRGGANPDGGIDLIIERDGVRTAIQCKHWKTWNVGVKPVRELLGALTDTRIQKGAFVTLGGYTGEAKLLAEKHHILLINETDVARMINSTNALNDPAVMEILRNTRKLCPKCERELVLRTAGKGKGAGQQFWGCSGYPRCRFTMQA